MHECNEFADVVRWRWKSTDKIVIYVLISYIFESFFNQKTTDSFSPLLHATKGIIQVFFYFFCVAFTYVIWNVRIECRSHIFISNCRCSEHVKLRSVLYACINQLFLEYSAFDSAFKPVLKNVFAPIFTPHLAIFSSNLPPPCFFLLIGFLFFFFFSNYYIQLYFASHYFSPIFRSDCSYSSNCNVRW